MYVCIYVCVYMCVGCGFGKETVKMYGAGGQSTEIPHLLPDHQHAQICV